MAMGGGPTMYKYQTPSGDKTMDGQAMALRAGLPLRDMEMVQFPPTGLLAGNNTRMTGTVLEEGLRGAGGYLLNSQDHRFMFDYDTKGERATRDLVSRAIYSEMKKNNSSPNGGVFISMSHLGPDVVRSKFPGMVKRCADSGFDLAGGKVEVVPTAHYLMGGVVVDVDTRTEVPGLFVAGEDAGGAHGSNRLGGNGVANSTVYGGVAGDVMGQEATRMNELRTPDEGILEQEIMRACAPFNKPVAPLEEIREKMRQIMWDDVGVVKTGSGLIRGSKSLAALEEELNSIGVDDKELAFNLTWHDWLNLKNLMQMSNVIAQAALARENSRGAHHREDYPDTGELESSYFTLVRQSGNELSVSRNPVQFTIVKPGETILPEHEPESLVG